MTAREKRALVARLQAGRRAAKRRRPERLREVEARQDALAVEMRELRPFPEDQERRREIRAEIRELGAERMRLKWGASDGA